MLIGEKGVPAMLPDRKLLILKAIIENYIDSAEPVGSKALLFYPNLVRFLQCTDGADNAPTAEVVSGIRKVGVEEGLR